MSGSTGNVLLNLFSGGPVTEPIAGGGNAQNAYGSVPQETFAPSGIYSFQIPQYIQAQSFTYAPSQGVSTVDPNAFAALQNSLVTQESAGLAAITNVGAAEYSGALNLFSQFGQNLDALGTASSNIFQTVANNSAHACSGFFGCLF